VLPHVRAVRPPADIPVWLQAARGRLPDWAQFLGGYAAAAYLPAAAFWQELAAAGPDALIILSVRESTGQWWGSASHTVFSPWLPAAAPGMPMAAFLDMITNVLPGRLGMGDLADKDAMISAYERHNQAMRAGTAWPAAGMAAADGWTLITAALGLHAPGRPFPKASTR
jgi:hypothetical protein